MFSNQYTEEMVKSHPGLAGLPLFDRTTTFVLPASSCGDDKSRCPEPEIGIRYGFFSPAADQAQSFWPQINAT